MDTIVTIDPKDIEKEAAQELIELMQRVDKEKPKKADIDAVYNILAVNPKFTNLLGDLSSLALSTLIQSDYKGRTQQIFIEQHCKKLRGEYGYNESSALEKSLIDHIILCWVRLHSTEQSYTSVRKQNVFTLAQGDYWERRLSMAQSRYLKAVSTLAKVRRLLSAAPLAQINVNSQVLNAGSVQR